MAPPNRKGGGGLSLQTLGIASAASLTAAMVTSRLFPPGTIYASAMTPVVVAAVSELLHRPADRMSALRAERRTIVREARHMETARVRGDEQSPLLGAPDFALGDEADELAARSGNGAGARPVLPSARRAASAARRVHPKVWIATGLAAFLISVAVLTLPELIFGGAVATNHRTTFFGGHTSHQKTQTHTQTTPTQTTTQPTQTTPTQTQSTTQTTPTTTTDTGTTDTSTSPTGGTPAPTSSSTTPVPPPPTTTSG